MKTIWKYQIAVMARMPKGAEILTVQMQNEEPCVWAVVEPDAEKENRYLEVFGTGQPIHEDVERRYIGTFQQPPFVWHLFERLDAQQRKDGEG